jgi:hypothetical protein
MGNRATAGMTTQQTSDTESSTVAETSKSETTSTTASTTIAFTTRIDAFTTTLTHASTTSVGSTAMPSVTPGSGIFFNGAYPLKISYNEEYEDGYSACVAWERTEETYGNFNDHFFDKNALILIKFNTGTGETAPCFLDIDISKSGKMIVDIGLSASDEAEACTWLMMIPIPRENIADVTEITVRFSNMYTE